MSVVLAFTLTAGFSGTITRASAESSVSAASPVFPSEIQYPDKLIPLGRAIGIKMYSDGIIISSIGGVENSDGLHYPMYDAGLEVGDIIISIDGKKMISGDDLGSVVSESDGNTMTVEYERDGVRHSTQITPIKSSIDGRYKIGAWIRDSMAGVGTVTFVDPESGTFGALGHAICDIDTGGLMPLRTGSVMPATVTEVKKGVVGTPGELICSFDLKQDIGSLKSNIEQGIFGTFVDNRLYGGLEALEVADRSEITEGPAYIYSTVDGETPVKYDVEISKIYSGSGKEGRNMLVKITDPALIDKTGGIVQGMSGSPIIQNGKIIGALTHVLVNDPKKGYGIFIENMLDSAYEKSVENTLNAA